MNKKKKSILYVIIFLSFIAVIDYPFIARMINESEQSGVAMDYNETAAALSQETKEQYRLAAVEYNHSLASGLPVNMKEAFSNSDEQNPVYRSMLDIHDEGVMASLEIPKIKVSLPIYHGTSDQVLDKGAGHLEGSSLPVGGESTHAAIAGHRGLPAKKFFTNLDQIEAGDLFFIDVLGERLAYQVYSMETVTPDEVEPLKIIKGKDLVTLITCTPYGVNTHRIYVHGVRIPYNEGMDQGSDTSLMSLWKSYWWVALTVVLLIWMFVMLYLFHRRPGIKRKNL